MHYGGYQRQPKPLSTPSKAHPVIISSLTSSPSGLLSLKEPVCALHLPSLASAPPVVLFSGSPGIAPLPQENVLSLFIRRENDIAGQGERRALVLKSLDAAVI
ncbi:hypothetical protein AOLI_G00313960 [Acnodon oligacanthus]